MLTAERRLRDTTSRESASRDLSETAGVNGRLEDLRDGYAVLRDEYERAWLHENRPYWMHAVLGRYDLAAQTWIARMDRVGEACNAE